MSAPEHLEAQLNGLPTNPFVYFCYTHDRSGIRIGYTNNNDGNSARIKAHEKYGHKFLAAIPGNAEDEKNLHQYFNPHILVGFDSSTYDASVVAPYVTILIKRNLAVTNLDHIRLKGRAPYHQWAPKSCETPRHALFWPELQSAIEERDCWQTPPEIFEMCTKLFGKIDLDPASCLESYNRPSEEYRPRFFYTEDIDGLSLEWYGKIFLNPPYGGGDGHGSAKFITKLINEIKSSRVTDAFVVLNLQSMPTKWFLRMTKLIDVALAIPNKRISFIGPATKDGTGTRFGASKNGSVFVYYGSERESFWKIFGSFCYPLELKKKLTMHQTDYPTE